MVGWPQGRLGSKGTCPCCGALAADLRRLRRRGGHAAEGGGAGSGGPSGGAAARRAPAAGEGRKGGAREHGEGGEAGRQGGTRQGHGLLGGPVPGLQRLEGAPDQAARWRQGARQAPRQVPARAPRGGPQRLRPLRPGRVAARLGGQVPREGALGGGEGRQPLRPVRPGGLGQVGGAGAIPERPLESLPATLSRKARRGGSDPAEARGASGRALRICNVAGRPRAGRTEGECH
mmetsp:Transcript_76389/g.224068  ORF Transcript_76389/g.224068 Transcript_76389/m.224068 type:complete len:233 (-) Transcript_76389:11-709(-)